MNKLTGKRKVLLKALVGSHNYNLDTPESDRDYKVFVAPTFEDLYEGKSYSNSDIGAEADHDIHDIRKLERLLYKSNVNFMEILFSEDLQIAEDASDNTKMLLENLIDIKDDIARMNLPYLYHACIGMYHNKMKYLEKGTSGTMHLVEKYGYDTKQALHSYRILDFLIRFMNSGFNDFKWAITYSGIRPRLSNLFELSDREMMLNIKNGEYTLGGFKKIVEDKLKFVEEKFKPSYMKHNVNEETNDKLKNTIRDIVKEELL